MATKWILAVLPLILIIGVSAQGFGTQGVSARELPIGICVVEIDEVVDQGDNEFLDLVITETGRKPAFGKVQSLFIYGENEDGGPLHESQQVNWDSRVEIMSRTLSGISTGVAQSTVHFNPKEYTIKGIDSSGDLVSDVELGADANGIPIPSQGTAGEIRLGLTAINPLLEFFQPGEQPGAFDLHIAAVIESPVGNLCSINLVPVRPRCIPTTASEEGPLCSNGIDDDCDGKIDLEEVSCIVIPCEDC